MKNKHNEKYNYDLVKYISIKDKIKIICHTHGIFEQTADDHLSGKGCPKCAGRNKTTEEFIQESKKIHGDKYIYENIDFTKLTGLVTITCKKCGRFQQLAHIHLKGHGCPKCIGRDKTTEEFIQESKKIHGDKYIYDKVEYKKSDQKVDIICINHGVFTQTPSKHIKGRGCPKCKSSHGEQKIQMYLDDQNIEYIKEKTFRGCRNKNLLRFDFYLPEYNMCIEFDGKQHHEPFSFNRPRKITPEIYDEFIDLKKRDNIKNKYCTDNNIKLLRISYIEINKIECILNNFLNNIIHRQS
jgi:protein-arginine kinase activator protein McsA